MFLPSALNLFKLPIRLKLKNDSFFVSTPGEILSITIYAYLLYSFITSDFFTRMNPNILEKDSNLLSSPWYNFTEENMFVGVWINTVKLVGVPMDPQYFSLIAAYSSINYTQNVTTAAPLIEEMLVDCKDTYMSKANPGLIELYPHVACLANPRFTIGGSQGEAFQSLEIYLKQCNNKSSSITCKSQEEIDNFFQDVRISIGIFDHIIQGDNFDEPIIDDLTIFTYNIATQLRKMYNKGIEELVIESSDSLFLSRTQKSWRLEDVNNDIDLNADVNLIEFTVYSSTNQHLMTRTYMSIYTALGSLGGIANILICVGFIILRLSPCSPEAQLDSLLSNNLFSFKRKSELKKKENSSSIKKSKDMMQKKDLNTEVKEMLNKERKVNLNTSREKTLHTELEEKLKTTNTEEKLNKGIVTNPDEIMILSERYAMMESATVQKSLIVNDFTGSPPKFDIQNNKEVTANIVEEEKIIIDRFKIKMAQSDKSEKKKKSKICLFSNTSEQPQPYSEKLESFKLFKNKENRLDLRVTDLSSSEKRRLYFQKRKAFGKARKKMHFELDILKIMERFQEIDKIKMILFTPEQMTLFDLIAKPLITIDDDEVVIDEENTLISPGLEISHNLKSLKEISDENFLKMIVYYNKMRKKDHVDKVESRILQLIDDDLKDFLEG